MIFLMLCQPLQLGYSGFGEFFFPLSGVLLLSLAGLPSYHVAVVRAVDPFFDDLVAAADAVQSVRWSLRCWHLLFFFIC